MIRAVILDFGGVMRRETEVKMSQRLANLFGMEREQVKAIMGPPFQDFSTGKIDEMEFWRQITTGLGKDLPENFRQVWEEKGNEFALLPGMAEWAEDLKRRGYKRVILSNTVPPFVEHNRKEGWYDGFDGVYLSNEMGYRKPDIKAYKFLLEKEDLKPEECLFIDDREENLVTAGELGMKTVLSVSPDQVIGEAERILAEETRSVRE